MHLIGSYLVWRDAERERGERFRAERGDQWLAVDAQPFTGPDARDARPSLRTRLAFAVWRLAGGRPDATFGAAAH